MVDDLAAGFFLEPDPIPPFTGKTSAAGEFSTVFRLKAYLDGTVLVEEVVKNPGPGVLAGRGGWVRLLAPTTRPSFIST